MLFADRWRMIKVWECVGGYVISWVKDMFEGVLYSWVFIRFVCAYKSLWVCMCVYMKMCVCLCVCVCFCLCMCVFVCERVHLPIPWLEIVVKLFTCPLRWVHICLVYFSWMFLFLIDFLVSWFIFEFVFSDRVLRELPANLLLHTCTLGGYNKRKPIKTLFNIP